jgi:membrane protease YdiL (CAAX protease family)
MDDKQDIDQQDNSQQENNQKNLNQQNLNQQNLNQQNLNQQVLNQQNLNQQNLNQQNINQQNLNQQNINQQNINQQNISQQNINQQNINHQILNKQYTNDQNTHQQGLGQYNTDQYHTGQYGMQEEFPSKKILSRAGMALFVTGLMVLLAQIVVEVLVSLLSPSIANTGWYVWALTAFAVVGVGFPTFYTMIKRIPDSKKREVVKMKPTHFIGLFFICTAAMYITNFLSVILTTMIALLKGDNIFDMNPLVDAITGSNFILTILYASIVAPIVEELIFRKYLLNKLRRFGDVPAILLTGFAFGLFHMNLSQFFYASALGIIFAYVAIRTNTVRYTILLHIMINFIGTVVTPLATSKNILFSILIVAWVLSAIALGSVFFILNVRKIRLEKSEWPLLKKSDYFFNLGTILYTVFCLVVIIIVTVS